MFSRMFISFARMHTQPYLWFLAPERFKAISIMIHNCLFFVVFFFFFFFCLKNLAFEQQAVIVSYLLEILSYTCGSLMVKDSKKCKGVSSIVLLWWATNQASGLEILHFLQKFFIAITIQFSFNSVAMQFHNQAYNNIHIYAQMNIDKGIT